MTAITKDQINQELFAWEDFSRGFHGERFESKEICVFDEAGEKGIIRFSVEEYTSDRTDYFGVDCPAWKILAFCVDSELCVEVDRPEYRVEREYELGADYARKEFAMDFCEYILASYLEHQNFSRLPYVKFD